MSIARGSSTLTLFTGIYRIRRPSKRSTIWKTGFGSVWAITLSINYEQRSFNLQLTAYETMESPFSRTRHLADLLHFFLKTHLDELATRSGYLKMISEHHQLKPACKPSHRENIPSSCRSRPCMAIPIESFLDWQSQHYNDYLALTKPTGKPWVSTALRGSLS